ncbi:MAG: competence/damage-inducible protein A [Clostridiales Family XIII bacterium]|jgi:nicotinamide-nucleotide amidase|nr:competence/damage-inducible protein A [Clostridiales Family XIII bacterium]
MRAAIIAVGTELLFGQTTDTNSTYISAGLQTLGVDVMHRHAVGDNPTRLRRMLEIAYQDCDLVITTGGLGPTQDDLTKEVVTEFLGDRLALHEESLEEIEGFFRRMGRTMAENNRKQALLPSRGTAFPNAQGTAPGFALESSGRTAICLPGPPREMTAMFELYVKPYLRGRGSGAMCYRVLRAFNIGESDLETALLDLIEGQTDPTIATYAKEGECSLRIASKRATEAEARAAADAMAAAVMERLGARVFSADDEDLHTVAGKELIARGVTISCAESCTGGLFAARLTETPGISQVFGRGFVTYSNESKTQELGVPEEIIRRHGAVSEETAVAMAEGLAARTGSRMAVAVTGIAGPDGGTPEKPVGLAYICCLFDGKRLCKRIQGRDAGRRWNRNYATLHMFYMVWRMLRGDDAAPKSP